MNKNVLISMMLLVLFAISQTGIAMHEVTHIDSDAAHTQSDSKDQNTSQEHCDHCIAKASSDTASIPPVISLFFSFGQHQLATIAVANLTSRLPKLYSPRAPPAV